MSNSKLQTVTPEALRQLVEQWRQTAEVLARASRNPRNGQAENDRMMEGSMTLDKCADELAAQLQEPPA